MFIELPEVLFCYAVLSYILPVIKCPGVINKTDRHNKKVWLDRTNPSAI